MANLLMGHLHMDLNITRSLGSGTTPYCSLALLLLIFAILHSRATRASSPLNDLFIIIFGVGIALLVFLTAILRRSLCTFFAI